MGKTCAFGVTFIDCRDRRPRLSLKPNFKNSNFSKEEFSDTSSVPKTLFVLFINGSPRTSTPTGLCGVLYFDCRGDHRSSVIYKISFCLKRTVGDAGPYRFGGGFDVLVVGAIQESPCLTQCHQKPSLAREGGSRRLTDE